MKIFKFEIKLLIIFTSITFLLGLSGCEKDENDIGSDLIPDKSQANKSYVDIVAYNINNNDSIRADATTLASGLVGIYEDNIFGKSKAAFNTQIRLSANDAILGTAHVVDSVVLSIFPSYDSSKPKSFQKNINTDQGEAIRYRTQYPLNSFLGKGDKVSMALAVNEIAGSSFLESSDVQFFSNKKIDVATLLGTKSITDSVESISIKTKSGVVVQEATTPGYRIQLDKDFFQKNFFDKKGTVDLSDNTHFIRYFNGIRISTTDESSKFMFSFPKTTMTLVAYYRYKNSISDTEYQKGTYTFTTNSVYNSNVGEYNFYDRSTASAEFNSHIKNPNKTQGESKLFLQGMGGPTINIKLSNTQIEELRSNVKNNGWAIISAKLKFYMAEEFYAKPSYIYGYAYNADKGYFLPDLNLKIGGYLFNPPYDLSANPGYYTLNVTRHIKDIVEKNAANDNIIVGMGNFLAKENGAYIGYYRNTRAYEPFRLVFYGNNLSGSDLEGKKLRLEIIYTK